MRKILETFGTNKSFSFNDLARLSQLQKHLFLCFGTNLGQTWDKLGTNFEASPDGVHFPDGRLKNPIRQSAAPVSRAGQPVTGWDASASHLQKLILRLNPNPNSTRQQFLPQQASMLLYLASPTPPFPTSERLEFWECRSLSQVLDRWRLAFFR